MLHVPLAELLLPEVFREERVGLRRPGGSDRSSSSTSWATRSGGPPPRCSASCSASSPARSAAASSTTTDRARAPGDRRVHAAGRFGAGWLLGSDSVSCRSVRRCCSGPARTSAPPTRRPTRPTGPLPLAGHGHRRAGRRRLRLGPDRVVPDPLPAAQRRRCPSQKAHNIPLEILYTAIPVVIVAVLFVFTVRTAARRHRARPTIRTSPSRSIGFQWQWQFRYEDPTAGPAGRHRRAAVTPPELVLPVGRTTRLRLVSRGRQPLVLGARVPREARPHPGRRQRDRRHADRAGHLRRPLRRVLRARPLAHELLRAGRAARPSSSAGWPTSGTGGS